MPTTPAPPVNDRRPNDALARYRPDSTQRPLTTWRGEGSNPYIHFLGFHSSINSFARSQIDSWAGL